MELKVINSSASELLTKLGQLSQEKTDEIVSIVNKHSIIAAGAGWVPIPFLDMAVVAGNVWSMYAAINKVLGISFSANLLKSIGSGVVANISSTLISNALLSLLKLVPGIGTISAGLILTAGNYAICTAAGWVYLNALCAIASEDGVIDPSDPDLQKKFRRIIKDQKEASRKIKDELQKEYILAEKAKKN